MKVTDLMINDLVYYIDGEQPIPVVVKMIDGKCDVVCLRQSDGHLFHATIDSLLPIPLTLEIFEKNGFKTMSVFDYIASYWNSFGNNSFVSIDVKLYKEKRNASVRISKCYDNCRIKSIHNNDICFVHEFQHALYICGIEKEIVIT